MKILTIHKFSRSLHNGLLTTLIQRLLTRPVLAYGIFTGVPIEDGDLLVSTNTLPVLRVIYKQISDRMVELDRKMIDALIARGFKWDMGEDGAGHQMKIRRRFGGYYLDAGCAQLIIDGKIEGEVISDGSLTVGENALIKGEVKTRSVIIFGKVEGNITVNERCELKSNAVLVGDVNAGTLSIAADTALVPDGRLVARRPVGGDRQRPGPRPARRRLASGFCSSARGFAPRFLPTLGRPRAVAVRFGCDGLLPRGLAPPRSRPCRAHPRKRGPRPVDGALF